MPKFRKRPVVVEAAVYRFDSGLEDGFMSIPCPDGREGCAVLHRKPYINTLEGPIFISDGDWIIIGIKGERYPCKPDIFEATYELVEE